MNPKSPQFNSNLNKNKTFKSNFESTRAFTILRNDAFC